MKAVKRYVVTYWDGYGYSRFVTYTTSKAQAKRELGDCVGKRYMAHISEIERED